MTEQISPDGHSGCSSLIFDRNQGGFDSYLNSAMGLCHDPIFLPMDANICTGTSVQQFKKGHKHL